MPQDSPDRADHILDEGYLDRDSGHRVFYRRWGAPDGIPVIVLHGGPGSGCRPALTRFFDPSVYQVLLMDQRGAGRSIPAGRTDDNTTDALVGDMEALRDHFGIARWIVFGGSWGATLGLRYVARARAAVLGLVLRGPFAGRRRDRDWLFGPAGGGARIFPDAYERFQGFVAGGGEPPADPVGAYWRRLNDDSRAVREAAALHWQQWEAHVTLWGRGDPAAVGKVDQARISCHYAVNDYFLSPETGAIPGAADLEGVPGAIVQGRRDLVCPVAEAHDIRSRWPQAEFRLIEDGSHVDSDPGIEQALLDVMRDLPGRLAAD